MIWIFEKFHILAWPPCRRNCLSLLDYLEKCRSYVFNRMNPRLALAHCGVHGDINALNCMLLAQHHQGAHFSVHRIAEWASNGAGLWGCSGALTLFWYYLPLHKNVDTLSERELFHVRTPVQSDLVVLLTWEDADQDMIYDSVNDHTHSK